jgi:predicted alpha/beta hydrolase family esterase
MKNALILHGTLGSPDGNWFTWLGNEFRDRNMQVWTPSLPHAEQPSLREWADYVHANVPFEINEDTVIVGHSAGASLSLILAQESKKPIGCVAAVSVVRDNEWLDWRPNDRLFDVPYDYVAIQAMANRLLFLHSDNDPYVPLEHAQDVASRSHGELIVIPEQGHFNLEYSDEYDTFPKLGELLFD